RYTVRTPLRSTGIEGNATNHHRRLGSRLGRVHQPRAPRPARSTTTRTTCRLVDLPVVTASRAARGRQTGLGGNTRRRYGSYARRQERRTARTSGRETPRPADQRRIPPANADYFTDLEESPIRAGVIQETGARVLPPPTSLIPSSGRPATVQAPHSPPEEGTPHPADTPDAGPTTVMSGRSRDRQRATLTTATGHLTGRTWAVFRGR